MALMSPQMDNRINKTKLGAISELLVGIELTKQGYEVYQAMTSSSDCDIIAIKDDEIRKIEVRTGQYYTTKSGKLNLHYPKNRTKGKEIIVYTELDNKIHYIKP